MYNILICNICIHNRISQRSDIVLNTKTKITLINIHKYVRNLDFVNISK